MEDAFKKWWEIVANDSPHPSPREAALIGFIAGCREMNPDYSTELLEKAVNQERVLWEQYTKVEAAPKIKPENSHHEFIRNHDTNTSHDRVSTMEEVMWNQNSPLQLVGVRWRKRDGKWEFDRFVK